MERWGFDIDPMMPVRSLDPAHRSIVAITRALAADARIIVLDEPTAALPRHDVEILFNAIERLRDGGVGAPYYHAPPRRGLAPRRSRRDPATAPAS